MTSLRNAIGLQFLVFAVLFADNRIATFGIPHEPTTIIASALGAIETFRPRSQIHPSSGA